jgi:hypothetical protein
VSRPRFDRETAEVKKIHPGLDDSTARRVAESYTHVATSSDASLSGLLSESRRAENTSAAGNDVTP